MHLCPEEREKNDDIYMGCLRRNMEPTKTIRRERAYPTLHQLTWHLDDDTICTVKAGKIAKVTKKTKHTAKPGEPR